MEVYDAKLCLNVLFLPPSLRSGTSTTNKNIHWSTKLFLQEDLPLCHHRLHKRLLLHKAPNCLGVSKNPLKAHLLSRSKG